jgi:hypothetical protein
LTGNHAVQVDFYATDTGGTSTLCSASSGTSDPNTGAFTVDVSGCDAALQSAADAFVQLTVDTSMLIPPSGSKRPRVGAVPYAVQAVAAQTATSATMATTATSAQTAADYVYTVKGKTMSVGTFCGVSANATTGSLGGPAGVKSLCETTCPGRPDAHMCTNDEVARYVEVGGTFPQDAWYMSFAYDGAQQNDCQGWTLGDATRNGRKILSSSSPPLPQYATCDTPFVVACCAAP